MPAFFGNRTAPATTDIVRELVEVLKDAASERDFSNWVQWATGEDPANLASGGRSKIETMTNTLAALFVQDQATPGILDLLLLEAYRARPLRPELRDVIARIRPRIRDYARIDNVQIRVTGPAGTEAPLGPEIGSGLQDVLRQQKLANPKIPMPNGMVWARGLYENLSRVCRIDIGGQGAGTGFLVGPQAVLTNWHVVENVSSANISCRFDYAVEMSGQVNQGTVVALETDGILLHSPYWPNERTGVRTPEGPPPDCLDFALLHIQADPRLDARARGAVRLTANPAMPPDNGPLIILQHPNGVPVVAAIDTAGVMGWELRDDANQPFWTDGNRTRFRYRTNTMSGSSGSPCFAFDWTLVALHHMGHDGAALAATANQGVPAGLIHNHIVAHGLAHHLAA